MHTWLVCGKNLNIVSMCAVSPWCTHRTPLVVKKNFSSFPVAVNSSIKLGPLVFPVISICNHGEHYETPCINFWFLKVLKLNCNIFNKSWRSSENHRTIGSWYRKLLTACQKKHERFKIHLQVTVKFWQPFLRKKAGSFLEIPSSRKCNNTHTSLANRVEMIVFTWVV
jgi:hypothetical protein